jgi:hypothetical protein
VDDGRGSSGVRDFASFPRVRDQRGSSCGWATKAFDCRHVPPLDARGGAHRLAAHGAEPLLELATTDAGDDMKLSIARASALLCVLWLATGGTASAGTGASCPNATQDPTDACLTKATVDPVARTLTILGRNLVPLVGGLPTVRLGTDWLPVLSASSTQIVAGLGDVDEGQHQLVVQPFEPVLDRLPGPRHPRSRRARELNSRSTLFIDCQRATTPLPGRLQIDYIRAYRKGS